MFASGIRLEPGTLAVQGTGRRRLAVPRRKTMSTEERFATDVLACVDELNALLPRLATRFEDLVIVAALAEHVGGALRIFMHADICSPEQARRVLAHIESTAFSTELKALLDEAEDAR